MNESHTETVEFEVNLPKPRPRHALPKILVGILALGLVGAIAVFIISRTASPTIDPTTLVMPADTQLYFSMTTHPQTAPNFDVITNAWKGSKEAKQIETALNFALTSVGFDWQEDIVPWLGDHAAIGLVDLGGYDKPVEPSTSDKPSFPTYRAPFYLIAVQTKDTAKSDSFLARLRKQLESKITPSDYFTQTIADDNYRGLPIVYMTTEYGGFTSSAATKGESLAYATVKDVIVLTANRDQLKKAIDAALDGANLSVSNSFKDTMAALPNPNVAAIYMDFNRFFTSYMNMVMGLTQSTSETFDNIYANVYSKGSATPDPNMMKRLEEQKRLREEAQRKQQEQLQKLTDVFKAYGGVGMAMTYDASGIRFDLVEQFDQAKLPAEWHDLFGAAMSTPVNNKVFDSLPASTMLVMNGSALTLKGVLDPNYLQMSLAGNPALQGVDLAAKLSEFQKLTGVDLKADIADQLNGEFAVAMLPRTGRIASEGWSFPFDFAFLLDATDAGRVSASLDKIAQAAGALSNNSFKWQSLSGLPYSVLLDNHGNAVLTYGVVDGRLVIGTSSDTLLSIDNANSAALANDATFKDALNGLPGNRSQTFYFQFKPIWDLLQSSSGTAQSSGMSSVLNYLRPFRYISMGTELPNGNFTHGVMRIAIEAAK